MTGAVVSLITTRNVVGVAALPAASDAVQVTVVVPTANVEQRIDKAVDAIRGMSQDLADEVAPRPGLLDRLSAATREAPIPSLAIAFLIGVIVARR